MPGSADRRFLFVCGRNRLRSPTAEQIFANTPGVSTASTGTRKDADVELSGELIEWADKIFVMERRHRKIVQSRFPDSLGDRRIVCLDIPDKFALMDDELIGLLELRMRPHLP